MTYKKAATYEKVMNALGDPTRRTVYERLRSGPRSVGEVADGLPVSRPAVSQHLRVLREAGLVSERREGTRRIYELSPSGLAELRAYFELFWSEALDAYKTAAERKENGK
jgi:DNA-binding transcriptional ArsR family regulator